MNLRARGGSLLSASPNIAKHRRVEEQMFFRESEGAVRNRIDTRARARRPRHAPAPALADGEVRVARLVEGAVRVGLAKADPGRGVGRRLAAEVADGLDEERGRDEGEQGLPHEVAPRLLGQVLGGDVGLVGEGRDRRAAVGEVGKRDLWAGAGR